LPLPLPDQSSSLPRSTKHAQRRAQYRIEGALRQAWLALHLPERGTGFRLAKAEVAQGGEDPGASLDFVRLHAAATVAAVRVAGAQGAVVVRSRMILPRWAAR
jgi:hypothetical protein